MPKPMKFATAVADLLRNTIALLNACLRTFDSGYADQRLGAGTADGALNWSGESRMEPGSLIHSEEVRWKTG